MTTLRNIPAKQQASTARRILAIGAAARAALGDHSAPEGCAICGRPTDAPYRRYDATGRVIEGCIAAEHHGRLIGESARWHNRVAAAHHRRAVLAHLESL